MQNWDAPERILLPNTSNTVAFASLLSVISNLTEDKHDYYYLRFDQN